MSPNALLFRSCILAALPPTLGLGCSSRDAPAGGEDAVADSGAPSNEAAAQDSADDSALLTDAPVDVAPESAPDPGTPYVYVGQGDGRIVQFDWDAKSGTLTQRASFDGSTNPSFLAVDEGHAHLYAVDESASRVVAFAIAKGTGALTKLNDVDSGGAGPAFVWVDATGSSALVANYGGGTVAVFPIKSDGSLGDESSGDAPGANAHSFLAGPTNAFAYAPTLGIDAVAQYAFDAKSGSVTPLTPAKVSLPVGTGPRHIAFRENVAFVIGEIASTMSVLAIDGGGRLAVKQTLSTLPAGFTGTNTCADVHVHPSGKFLYGSNRGDDSIARFAIAVDGTLTLLGHTKTGGSTPRNFGLDPSGDTMLVANQASKTIVTFAIAADGSLSKLKSTDVSGNPAWVGVVRVPKS